MMPVPLAGAMSHGACSLSVPTYGAEIDAVLGQLLNQLAGSSNGPNPQPFGQTQDTRTADLVVATLLRDQGVPD